LSIECLPRDLPDVITVDVSALNIGDGIHVRDIQLPNGVTTRIPADLMAFSVMAPTVAEEPAAGAAPTAAPEVITAKKDDADAGGGGKGQEVSSACCFRLHDVAA
jgi:large subunit ribosomal protein L25